jgi:MarR family transcriptional regulator, 2-MHQ and catechol-resistance regulon repressor
MVNKKELSRRDKLLVRMPPLLATGGFVEDKLGDQFIFQKIGLNHDQYVILMNLWKYDKPTKMKDIAQVLVKSPTNATLQVDKLEKSGLIVRIPSKKDRRIQYVEITKKGLKLLESVQKEVLVFLRDLFSDISNDDMETTIRTLRRLFEHSQDLLKIDLGNVLRLIDD